MGPLIILGVIALFVIIFAVKGFMIIQQSETMVIERLGRYHRTLPSGINILWPLFDIPRQIEWRYVRTEPDGRVIIRKDKVKRIDLRETVYALDTTTIDLCLSVFPWAPFRTTKAAVRLHTLLDLRGNIPTFLHVSHGKLHEVNILDQLVPEPGRSTSWTAGSWTSIGCTASTKRAASSSPARSPISGCNGATRIPWTAPRDSAAIRPWC
jgi:hypothetical protein